MVEKHQQQIQQQTLQPIQQLTQQQTLQQIRQQTQQLIQLVPVIKMLEDISNTLRDVENRIKEK